MLARLVNQHTADRHSFQLRHHITASAKLAQDTSLLRWSILAATNL